jgi:hypothetical protein
MFDHVFARNEVAAVGTPGATIAATTNSASWDRNTKMLDGYVAIQISNGTGTGSGSIAIKAQESDDDSTYTDIPANTAFTTTGSFTSASASPQAFHYQTSKRYNRLVYTLTGTLSVVTVLALRSEARARTA